MATFIVGFVIICAIAIVYNFTMKYKTLYDMHKDQNGKS